MHLVMVSVLAAALQCGDSPNEHPDEVRPNDYSRIQGAWVVEEWIYSGRARMIMKGHKVVFTNSKVSFPLAGTEPTAFRLNSMAKLPTIDIADFAYAENIGIYELQKDTLVICLDRVRYGRPTEFVSPIDSNVHLLKLKRAPK